MDVLHSENHSRVWKIQKSLCWLIWKQKSQPTKRFQSKRRFNWLTSSRSNIRISETFKYKMHGRRDGLVGERSAQSRLVRCLSFCRYIRRLSSRLLTSQSSARYCPEPPHRTNRGREPNCKDEGGRMNKKKSSFHP